MIGEKSLCSDRRSSRFLPTDLTLDWLTTAFGAHEKPVEPSTRQTCKKTPLCTQYTALLLLPCAHEVFVVLEAERHCKVVSLVMFWLGEHYIMQCSGSSNFISLLKLSLLTGEFPETLCIEQGVVLSCRFAEWNVRRASRVLQTQSGVSHVSSQSAGSASSDIRSRRFLISINLFIWWLTVDYAPISAHCD